VCVCVCVNVLFSAFLAHSRISGEQGEAKRVVKTRLEERVQTPGQAHIFFSVTWLEGNGPDCPLVSPYFERFAPNQRETAGGEQTEEKVTEVGNPNLPPSRAAI